MWIKYFSFLNDESLLMQLEEKHYDYLTYYVMCNIFIEIENSSIRLKRYSTKHQRNVK